jgi:hypothetical protein
LDIEEMRRVVAAARATTIEKIMPEGAKPMEEEEKENVLYTTIQVEPARV